MLVLTRKVDQKIMIGDDIVITLKEIKRDYAIFNITDLTSSNDIKFWTGQVIKLNNFTVRFVARYGSQIHVGIDAPRSIPVHREEVYNRIQAQLNTAY